jgi:hypothetical protein
MRLNFVLHCGQHRLRSSSLRSSCTAAAFSRASCCMTTSMKALLNFGEVAFLILELK